MIYGIGLYQISEDACHMVIRTINKNAFVRENLSFLMERNSNYEENYPAYDLFFKNEDEYGFPRALFSLGIILKENDVPVNWNLFETHAFECPHLAF